MRARITVHGSVQGVGFRWWVMRRADELGLVGSATNEPNGRVEVIAQGDRLAVERLHALITGSAAGSTCPGDVDWADIAWLDDDPRLRQFSIG